MGCGLPSNASHAPAAGSAAVTKNSRTSVTSTARCAERQRAETTMPSATEKKSVLTATSAMRSNSPRAPPPMSGGTRRVGTTATAQWGVCSDRGAAAHGRRDPGRVRAHGAGGGQHALLLRRTWHRRLRPLPLGAPGGAGNAGPAVFGYRGTAGRRGVAGVSRQPASHRTLAFEAERGPHVLHGLGRGLQNRAERILALALAHSRDGLVQPGVGERDRAADVARKIGGPPGSGALARTMAVVESRQFGRPARLSRTPAGCQCLFLAVGASALETCGHLGCPGVAGLRLAFGAVEIPPGMA